jgi:hypothetical protein
VDRGSRGAPRRLALAPGRCSRAAPTRT